VLALHTTVSLSTLLTFPDFMLLSNQTGLHFGVANRLVFHISACKSKQHHNLIIHDSLTSNPCEAYVLIRAPRSVPYKHLTSTLQPTDYTPTSTNCSARVFPFSVPSHTNFSSVVPVAPHITANPTAPTTSIRILPFLPTISFPCASCL